MRINNINKDQASSKDLFQQKDFRCQREILLSQLGLLVTLIATGFFGWELISCMIQGKAWLHIIEDVLFLGLALGLVYGNIVYQLTRIGYLRRLSVHTPAQQTELDQLFIMDTPPALTVLVPSYKEDQAVIKRTLISAALQEYPDKRVVLLIDNPPQPTELDDLILLNGARQLSQAVQAQLSEATDQFTKLLRTYEERLAAGSLDMSAEIKTLIQAHFAAGNWFERQAKQHRETTHSDILFVNQTYLKPAKKHFSRARQLERILRNNESEPTAAEIHTEYRRLAARFQVKLSSFERKKYLNLSHEANKAMNLNSYIGLLGQSLQETATSTGLLLEPCSANSQPTLSVAAADYLITLDADSILATDYALRLIEFAQRPANDRVAIIQTPYSAEPNPPTPIERMAGATTDMQFLIHQGFTYYGATFWVGANALVRATALHDLCIEEKERGYTVKRFIQDRTVIEDTESSVDLAAKGWTLYNYPERLSHSATPSDYGALLIQRRRWANGGLIILPKLLNYLLPPRTFFQRSSEGFFRVHYLTSIALVNFALPILLFYPFEQHLNCIWFPLTCLSYYLLYGRDLMRAGYRSIDLLQVYALNLLLLPVNLGGVFKSIQQIWTHEKIPFKRTPKVVGRTVAPAIYPLITLSLIIFCLVSTTVNIVHQQWPHAIFTLLNVVLLAYASIVFIGPRAFWEDLTGWIPKIHLPTRSPIRKAFRNYNLSEV